MSVSVSCVGVPEGERGAAIRESWFVSSLSGVLQQTDQLQARESYHFTLAQ